MDGAGAQAIQWSPTNGNMATAGPTWNSSTQHNPCSGTGTYNWNFNGIVYSVNGTTPDAGQTVANYSQTIKYGSAPA